MSNPDTRTRRQLLSRAWRHILSHALFSNSGRGIKILLLGVIAMLAQFGAVLAVVGAVRAWDNNGILSFAGKTLDLRSETGNLAYIYGAVGIFLLVLAMVMSIYNRVYVTKIGRQIFEEKLRDTRALIAERISGGQAFDRSACLAYLSRDCRFLSISYTRILMLLQPALLLIALFGLTIYLQSSAAVVMLIVGLLVLPAHAWMLTWAQRSSDDIADSAKLKSKEEQHYVDHLAQSPVALAPETVPGFAGGPGQNGFLSAFVKRQRLSAFSQAITDIMSLGILIVFGLFLLLSGDKISAIPAGSLVLLFILWRYLTSYISSLAQAVTMVSSYEPFFRGLLDFEAAEDSTSTESQAITLALSGDIDEPIRLAIFQKSPMSWSLAAPLSKILSKPVNLISHDFNLSRENLALLQEEVSDLDAKARAEIEHALSNQAVELSPRTQLLLSIASADIEDDGVYMLDGSALTTLKPADLREILQGLGSRGLVVFYRGLPGRIVLPPRFQLAASNGVTLSICGQAHDYQSVLSELKSSMANKLDASTSETYDDDVLFDEGI